MHREPAQRAGSQAAQRKRIVDQDTHAWLYALPSPLFAAHPTPSLVAAGEPRRVVAANEAMLRLAEAAADTLDGVALTTLLECPPASADGLACRTRLLTKPVSGAEVEVTALPLDSDPDSLWLVTLRDCRREHDAVLRQRASDMLADLAGDAAGLGGWHADLATGRVTWTGRTYRLFGVDAAEEIDVERALGFFVPGHRERVIAAIETCARDGTPYDMDIVATDMAGERFPVRAIGAAVRDDAGRIVALQGAAQDLRPMRSEARTFAENWDRFERLADSMPHIVWTAQPDGTLDYASAIFTNQFAGQAFDIARDWPRAIHPDDRADNLRRWSDAVATGSVFEHECRIRRDPDGDHRWHQIVARPIHDAEGRLVRWFGTSTDIHERRLAEERTQELAARLQSTLDSITDAFLTVDSDFRILFLNRAAQRVLDHDAAQLIGRNLWEAFPDARGTVFEQQYQAALSRRETQHFRGYYAPLGLWLDVSAYPTDDGLSIYFRDVTVDRRREERLRLLELAVERINDAVLITQAEPLDAPGPRIQYVNEAFTRHSGYRAEEAVGRSPRFLQGPLTDRAALDRIRTSLEAWRPSREELVNYRKDGTPFWIELIITPLLGDDGFCTHWVAVQRDVTARKAAEEAATRRALQLEADNGALQRLTTMTGPRPLALARLVVELRALTAARAAAFIETVSDGPTVTATDGIAPDAVPLAAIRRAGLWAQALETGEAVGAALSDEASREENMPADLTAAAVAPIDGGCLAVLFGEAGQPDADRLNSLGIYARTADNVLQRMRVEEQLRQAQRLEALGQLTGGIAHDFNNLLTIVLGNAELLTESLADDDSLRPLAEMTQTAATRGAELTSRLLSFARRQTLDTRPTPVSALVDSMSLIIERTLGSTVDIAISHADELWPALADAPQLENAILNLCLNARDAMPGGGRLTIETRNVQLDEGYADANVEVAPGDYVLVAVSDTGTGMSQRVRERAFEPFFTTKPAEAGSGLGLSMVFGFAKQSRGHVQIYSEVGEGTTVKLYLPRAPDDSAALREPEGTAPLGGPETILVVEDNALVREHVTVLLRGLGYRVIVAPDAATALARLREARPVDLLFTDIVMPGGMDGRELAELAQGMRPGLPVLFTSGYTETAITRQGRLGPGINILNKPYRRMDLATKLRSLLDNTTYGSGT
jgi:PAS domain S-box-containing protein